MSDKIKIFFAHIFSWHSLVVAFGWAMLFTAQDPSLAKWHALLQALGVAFNLTGVGMASAFDPAKARARAGIVANAAPLILFVFLATHLSACLPTIKVCSLPHDPSIDAKCQLEQDLIHCGASTGLDLIPVVISIVLTAINSGSFDTGKVVSDLESLGFKDIPCVLAALQNYLLPISPQLAGKIHEALVYKLNKDGKRGMIQIKLHSGRSVAAVVQ